MTVPQVLEVIERVKEQKISFAPLVTLRKSMPKGHKIRTPFGNCEIANVQRKPEGIQVVFYVKLAQLEFWEKKMKSEIQAMLKESL